MRGKDRAKDRWYSRFRTPYEGVFSQQRRRVRYRGIAKISAVNSSMPCA